MRVALSIAGSDPTGGAGLQADLQTFAACGVHGAGVVTALTVQDTVKVKRVLPVFPNVVREQLQTLAGDLAPHVLKLGMLATDDVARAVDHGLDAFARAGPAPPLVLDPVLAASDGTPLLERRALPILCRLIGRAQLVTPNLSEAETLCERDVSSRAGVEAAARSLVEELGAGAALVKGGHAADAPDDCLALREGDGVAVRWLAGERIPAGPVHGTGCALAAAAAAHLALGSDVAESVERARRFVAEGLRHAFAAGAGARFLGRA